MSLSFLGRPLRSLVGALPNGARARHVEPSPLATSRRWDRHLRRPRLLPRSHDQTGDVDDLRHSRLLREKGDGREDGLRPLPRAPDSMTTSQTERGPAQQISDDPVASTDYKVWNLLW